MMQSRLVLPVTMILLLGAAIPLSPPVEAGSWGFSGGYYRGGSGFGYRGHVGSYRSARYSAGYRYGRRGFYPGSYRYSGSRYCPTYRYRRGYYYGRNRYFRPRGYQLPASLANYTVYEANTRRDAWSLLAEGQIQSAQQVFAGQAERSPANGIPKIGYALAAALAGDFERAEWAMRRAFNADPDSLESIRIDPPLTDRLSSVVSYYKDGLGLKVSNPNAPFMLAALKFIQQDHEPASEYIELAIESGDLKASTFNLQKQLSGPEDS